MRFNAVTVQASVDDDVDGERLRPVLPPADSAQGQDAYQGQYVPCTPNPSPQPGPTERASWGRVEARYR